jgi:hypothetical protein
MVAVEFESVVKGKTIHLPKKYAEFDSQLKEKEKRMPGSAKSKIFLADDFEQPLDDESIKLFYQ